MGSQAYLRVETKSPQVLLRDATTLLLHFSLILPVQIDRVFLTTIVRQVDMNFIFVVIAPKASAEGACI